MRHEGLIVITLAVLSGCDGLERRAGVQTVSDSAGVEVVRVAVPSTTAMLTSRVVSEIGVASGRPEYELSDVSGALILRNGERVVANGGTHQLRFYDSDGSYLRAQGGEGEGPGEFESFDYLGLLGADTLVVYDAGLLRLSLLGTDGTFIGSSPIVGGTLPYVVGALDSGPFAAWQFVGSEPNSLGVYAASMEFGTVSRSEARFEVAGTLDGGEEGQVKYRGRATRAFRPFAKEGDVAAGGDRIYALSSSADNRIEVWDPRGRLIRVIAVDAARAPATAEATDAWVGSWMEVFPPPSEGVEEWWRFGFRELEPPDSVPLLRSLEIDNEGNVCAERYPMTWQSPSRYWCFEPNGEFVRGFELPPGKVRKGPHPFWDAQLQIFNDRVVGVWTDELGVQTVREFELGNKQP